MFIHAPLSRRAIQLFPLTLTLAMFLTPYHHWKGFGFKKTVCVQCPMPWASHPGAPSAESIFLEGSGLPSLVQSPLCSLNLVLSGRFHQQTIPGEMIWAAAMITVFLILLCIFHSSGEANHEFLCHGIKAIRILTISAFLIIRGLHLQVC